MSIFPSRKTDFGKKLKALRMAYNLKSPDLSRYLTIVNESSVSTGSISFWENEKRIPTSESILLIAGIFGVSLDWLISHEDYPEKTIYDEVRLEYLESKIIERTKNYDIRGEVYPFPHLDSFTNEYLDLEQRKTNFSHEARANIIFLTYVIDFEWQRYIKANITEFKSLDDISLKNLAMRVWDFLMTVPGDPTVIRECAKKVQTIMETKKPLYKVRW